VATIGHDPRPLARLAGVVAAAAVMLGGPVVALGHGLSPTYQSPLPLAVYLMGAAAIGAGLLPIAVGYLIAHYLTYLLIDGERITVAVSDPLQQGWDLFGTAFFQPSAGWLPPGLVWTAQLVAVVGGHMLGAWAGHVAAQRDLDAAAHWNGNGNGKAARDLRHRRIHDPDPLPGARRNLRRREIPLAIVMVALTTLTLWSLGQSIVVEQQAGVRPRPGVARVG